MRRNCRILEGGLFVFESIPEARLRGVLVAGAFMTQCVGVAFAAGPPLQLSHARAAALQHLPAPRAAGETVEAARLRRSVAGRLSGPTVGLGVENFGLDLGGSIRESAIFVEQPLELGGDRGARVDLADASIQIARAEGTLVSRDVVARVDEEFIAAWILQEKFALQAHFVELADEGSRISRNRHRAGAAPLGEALRAEAELQMRRVEQSRLHADRAAASRRLASLLGPSVSVDSLALDAPGDSLIAQGTPAFSAAAQPDQVRAEAEAQLAAAEARIARSASVPDLGLLMGVRRLEEENGVGLMVGVSTKLPLWSGAGTEADAADARNRAARLRAQEVTRRLTVEYESIRARRDATAAQERALRDQVRPALASALEQIDVAYRAGRVSGLEPIEARRSLREVDLALIDVQGDLARSDAELSRWREWTLEGARRLETER